MEYDNLQLTQLPGLEDILFVLYIFMRVIGLLIVSPLLSNMVINPGIRFYLGVATTILLAIVLFPQYRGPDAIFHIGVGGPFSERSFLEVPLICLQELGIGYIIGFCFNIVFEALGLAGALIDTMIGFSTAQFIDPFSFTMHSLLGNLLVLAGALFMLMVDFHHIFIRLVADSFTVLPIGHYYLDTGVYHDITTGTGWIFIYAVKYAAIPLIILACGLVGIAFTVRVVPEMNLLLTGLPMRVLLGIFTLILATGRLLPVFEQSFSAVTELAEQIILHLSGL